MSVAAEHVASLPSLGTRPNAPSVAKIVGPTRPWLLTIVDLMTILLTFFVLLFSMTKIDMTRFVPVARSYSDAFTVGVPEDFTPRLPEVAAVPGDNLSYLEAVLQTTFASAPSLADVEFQATPQYLILSWPGDALFAAGAGGLTEASHRRVFDLGGVLSNLHNRVAIVGEAAVDADGSADAWRLAIGRANAVADAFRAAGYDKDLTVLGRRGAGTGVRILIMPERPAS